ncbi:hypothetical protein [Candidatus Phytoplasma solani]|uniref:Uncharacterized protein n=1 Tax=Candidatus Phytoplasma solani TaxID=69896 RepID=A0A421NUX0_9MOLU|nr:hypothetical protein [Candidatus Phytoplasma solani]RMI87827.1 hypothetical protein PSSA1_v1c5200 [Candidatus Phytoplasma solani]
MKEKKSLKKIIIYGTLILVSLLLVGGFCCWWFGWFNSKPSKESSTQSVKPIDAEKRMQELITDNQAFNNVLTEIENIRYQHYPATYLDLKNQEEEKKGLIEDFKNIIKNYQTKYKNLKDIKEKEKTQKEAEENAAKNKKERLVKELATLQSKEPQKTPKEDEEKEAKNQIAILSYQIKSLEKSKIETKINNARGKLETLQGKIDGLKTQINGITSLEENQQVFKREELNDLQNQKEDKEKQKNDLNSSLTNDEETKKNLESEIKKLQSQLLSNNNNLDEINRNLSNITPNEIGRLVRELETLQSKEEAKTQEENKETAARTQKEKLKAESNYLDKFITFLRNLKYNDDIWKSNEENEDEEQSQIDVVEVFIVHNRSINDVLIKQLINQLQNESKDISFELFQAVNDINLKEEEIKATENNLELMAIKRNLLIAQQILKQYYVELNNFLTQQNNPSQLLIHQRALSELKYYLLRAIEVTDQIERQNKLSENEKDEVKAKGKNIISFVANIIGNNSITNPKIQEETAKSPPESIIKKSQEKLKYWQKNIVLPYKGEIKEENIEQQKLLKLIITNPKKDPNSEKSEIAFTFKETQPSTATTPSAAEKTQPAAGVPHPDTVTTPSDQPIQPENPEVNQHKFEFEKAETILHQWPSVFEEKFDADFKTKFSELMDETRYKEFKNQIASEGGFNQLTNQSNLGYRFLALGCQTNFANDINNPHFIDLLENIFDFGWQAR